MLASAIIYTLMTSNQAVNINTNSSTDVQTHKSSNFLPGAIVYFTVFMNHNYKSEWNFPFQKFYDWLPSLCYFHSYSFFYHKSYQ